MSVVGGFVSLQKRIQQIPFEEINQLRYGAFSIYLSPVIAAIFGALYYFALAGGLVSGALFPDLGALRAAVASGAACQSCTDVSRFREIAVNVSRLLVWAFMAGFAERLVPDTIDRFAAKSEGKAT
jgi:hypothetical protein